MNSSLFLAKLKASATHLGIASVIAGLSLWLIFKVWYPAPWSEVLAVSDIALLIIAIDVTLGPLLTFVIYQAHKASLKFDLAVIGVLQLSALVYGLYTVGLARPVYLVHSQSAFTLVTSNEVYDISGSGKTGNLTELSPWAQPLTGLKMVASAPPADADLANMLAFSSSAGGAGDTHIPALHVPYASALPAIQASAKPLADLQPKAASAQARIAEIRQRYPANSLSSPVYVSGRLRLLAILNRDTGAVLGFESMDSI